jgi:hypothetical protein
MENIVWIMPDKSKVRQRGRGEIKKIPFAA